MISLALVLVGMLALFKVLTSSISGSATSSRMSQAQVRLMTIIESLRHSPADSNNAGKLTALDCLVAAQAPNDYKPSNWQACETTCMNLLGTAKRDGCIYSMDSFSVINAPDFKGASSYSNNGQQVDRSLQQYIIDPRSRVKTAGPNNTVYDIDLWVGWWDDNSTTLPTQAQITAGVIPGYHTAHFRTGVTQ